MKGRALAVLVGALVLWTSGLTFARAAGDLGPSLLVRFAPTATAAERLSALAAIGGTFDQTIAPLGVTRIQAAAGFSADAAAAILAAGAADDLAEGVERAREAVDSGAAAERLEELIAFTQAEVPA
jgi:hypothetical protein